MTSRSSRTASSQVVLGGDRLVQVLGAAADQAGAVVRGQCCQGGDRTAARLPDAIFAPGSAAAAVARSAAVVRETAHDQRRGPSFTSAVKLRGCWTGAPLSGRAKALGIDLTV
ncbi:MAG TPA: hypothetical protein VLG91_08920 [Streptomyces sp.]|nr:hypothetical protein [Streptomyces sp.]